MSGYRSNPYPKIIAAIWVGFFGFIVALVLYVFAVSINFLNLFGELPDLKTLENPKSELASEVYSADNKLLGKYFRENRSPVTYDDLPENLIHALTATEDARFKEHSGIDAEATGRVIFSVLTGQSKGGGSTLTQQLAKNLFRTRADLNNGLLSDFPGLGKFIVKTKEWLMAIKLERNYTKEEIMTMYLNTVDFGSNSFGIKVAAKTFFNKAPKDLKLEESAVLVGLLKAPSAYSPVQNPERSTFRRNTVLGQMKKYNYIDESTFEVAKAKPIKLNYVVENANKGLAPYFRTEASKFLLKWCKDNGYDLYSDGLKIYTTIDSRMQQYAEDALKDHLKEMQAIFFKQWKGKNPWIDENYQEIKEFPEMAIKRTARYQRLREKYDGNKDSIHYYLNKKYRMTVFTWQGEKDTLFSPMDSLKYYKHFLQAGFMAMHPQSGHIKAWVGGADYKYFKYDHVKQGARQPGSTFKPFVYVTAIDAGYSPCYEVIDAPVSFVGGDGKTWTPKNSDGGFTGSRFTLRTALGQSINSVTAFLMKKVGPDAVVQMAQRLGISTPLDPVPPLALGSSDVKLYDLVGAYSTFVNKGVWTQPTYITRIEDKNGNVLMEFVPKTVDVLSEETAYLMVHMLQGATERKGTAYYGLRVRNGLSNEIGGKTGTTSNYSDAWFVGLTPDLVAGVWVGGEDRSIHFTSAAYGQGNKLAMPIYGKFMQKVYADKSLNVSKKPFPKPAVPLSVEIDCARYNSGAMDDSTRQQMLDVPVKGDLGEDEI